MKQKIIISVSNDLFIDNRVHKVATSLYEAGYNVLLLGCKRQKQIPPKRDYPTRLIKVRFKKTFLFYAEYNIKLFFFLLTRRKVDIFLSNDLDTLLPNFLVAKLRRKKIIYDSHELFTEVPELVNRPRVQKFWLTIEKFCLPKIKYSYTVCRSISDYYNKKYAISMQVVRNSPPLKVASQDLDFEKTQSKEKIIIYQGAVNIGRGLEECIEAMQYLDSHILWIVGTGDIINDLKESVQQLDLEEKVIFWGRKNLEELFTFTRQADLGISVEKNMGLNYYYALPNKIFDYIHAEIPVLCADLPEMSRIIKDYNVGEVLASRNPKEIARQIREMTSEEERIKEWKQNTRKAKKDLCWQNEEKQILKIISRLSSSPKT